MFSAYSKLEAIGTFEVYIFRSTFLSFDGASILARFIVAAEFVISIGSITKWAYKAVWNFTLLFILGMTGFLVKQVAFDNDENCFCLGELLEMSPMESFFKNVILIALLLAVRKVEGTLDFKFKGLAATVLYFSALVVPFIISPPDVFVKGQFNPAEHNQSALDAAISNGDIPSRFTKGRKLLSFYSMKCKYCKMSSERISAIVSKGEIDRSQVNIVFGGSAGNAIDFFEETNSQVFEFSRLPAGPFLNITKGKMPLTLLIQDGKVISQMNYKTIDEKEIVEFLSGKN